MLDTQPIDLILYTSTQAHEWQAYALNRTAQLLYHLCDGRRSIDMIGSEYSRLSGRPTSEVAGCLKSLIQKNLLLVGQTVRSPNSDLQPRVSPGGKWTRI